MSTFRNFDFTTAKIKFEDLHVEDASDIPDLQTKSWKYFSRNLLN